MNSTTALMLSRAIEAERRREVERRGPRRFVEPERATHSARRSFQIPRWFRFLRPAGTSA